MEAAKRVALNTGILYARMGVTVLISLYSTRLILNALGAKDFGLFNLVGGLILMLGFLNTSMAGATQRFMSYAHGQGSIDKVKQIFNVSMMMHLAIAVVLAIVLQAAKFFFFKYFLNISPERIESAKIVYEFVVFSTLITVISVPYDAIINARENMLLFAVIGITESILRLITAVLITISTSDKLVMYGLLMACISFLLLIMKACYCSRSYGECKIEIKGNMDKRLMRQMTGFAGWSFLGSTTSIIANYGQGVVMNTFFGTAVNAAQGIANQASGQLGVFASTMLKALNPLIDKSEGSGNRNLMISASMMGSKLSFFLLMFLFVPVLIEMPYILNIWLKDVPLNAEIFCQLLLVRNLIEQLFITLVSSIAAVGKIRKFQMVASFLAFFPLVISYALYTLGYPAYTLYVIFIIYSILASLNILYFARKTCGLSLKIFCNDVILRCVICFGVSMSISLIPHYIFSQGLVRLILVSIVSLFCFIVAVWNIGITQSERLKISKMASNGAIKLVPKVKRVKMLLAYKEL